MRNKFELLTDFPLKELKSRILAHCESFKYFSYLDSNNYSQDRYSRYNWLVAIGARKIFHPTSNPLLQLNSVIAEANDWLFGHLSYDLKNDIEDLQTTHPDTTGFGKICFFQPEHIIYSCKGRVWVESLEIGDQETFLKLFPNRHFANDAPQQLNAQTSYEEYISQVNSLKKHLQFGNIYEVNYCVEFSGQASRFSPTATFSKLNQSAAAPFSAYYRNNNSYLLCASPERYLQKKGNSVISQPIKGTVRRSANFEEDIKLKDSLIESEKERSENVMITDLVRNDLSKTAERGSVKVEELFGIYTFNTVHQMITTVSSRLKGDKSIGELLQTTFPMGSMTGAPKLKAMQLIEEHETFARSLFSGAVGYIDPKGDFDFNVVIRSIFYNATTSSLSLRVGSAITIHCSAEAEYEECLLKAENIFKILS